MEHSIPVEEVSVVGDKDVRLDFQDVVKEFPDGAGLSYDKSDAL